MYCVLCYEQKLCMYIKFIFVLWYVIVAFRGTTLPFYFSSQRLNQLLNESVVEVPAF